MSGYVLAGFIHVGAHTEAAETPDAIYTVCDGCGRREWWATRDGRPFPESKVPGVLALTCQAGCSRPAPEGWDEDV